MAVTLLMVTVGMGAVGLVITARQERTDTAPSPSVENGTLAAGNRPVNLTEVPPGQPVLLESRLEKVPDVALVAEEVKIAPARWRGKSGPKGFLAAKPVPSQKPLTLAKSGPELSDKVLDELLIQRWRDSRRSHATDSELRKQLLIVPEAGLEGPAGATKELLAAWANLSHTGADVGPLFMAKRPDLVGLRPHTGADCRLSREEATNLEIHSKALRHHLEASIPGRNFKGVVDLRPDPEILRERLLKNEERRLWLRPEAVPALRQLLMHEHPNARLILVEALAQIRGPEACQALASCVLFDLHRDVRAAALVALRNRPVRHFEEGLIAGLKYPFPAVADHAAEALIALELRNSVPKLVAMLDDRDPTEPFPVDWGQKRWTVMPELVRINHLRNCLLCHPPSFAPFDLVRAMVPNSAQLLPLPASGPQVLPGGGGYGGKVAVSRISRGGIGGAAVIFTFIRADITYLKQDFSLLQPVANHGPLWPADQRFDYMIRLRLLTRQQGLFWHEKLKEIRPVPPQQESLLFALRHLTGEDPGPSLADWKRCYSPLTGQRFPKPLDPDQQVLHLKDCLLEAPVLRQAQLVSTFKDKVGAAYDGALVLAIPDMAPQIQQMSRNVLADRMYCLPVKDLGDNLNDKNQEIRRAALKACLAREEKDLIPEIIDLLDDENAEVAKLAHGALRQFAVRDLGPPRNADKAQRQQAMAAWNQWWDQRLQKKDEKKK